MLIVRAYNGGYFNLGSRLGDLETALRWPQGGPEIALGRPVELRARGSERCEKFD